MNGDRGGGECFVGEGGRCRARKQGELRERKRERRMSKVWCDLCLKM